MSEEELKQEAEEYTKNLLKKLGIKEDMLLENQPKYLRQESMNFVALDVENVTDAYLASAEPREKRIAELEDKLANADYQLEGRDLKIKDLEKEIADLKNKLEHRNCLDCSNHSSKLRMRTLELEKENAELKETLKTYNGCGDWDNDFHTCRVYLQHEELQDYIEQLTKAKEIIREFMKYEINEYDGSLEIHFEELKKQAEQFLNSEVDK